MGQVIDFKKLSVVKLTKPQRGKKAINLPNQLAIHIAWVEIDKDGTEWPRELRFEPESNLMGLKPDGRLLLAEYCLELLGLLAYTDLNLGAIIKDKVLECVKDE